jgi:large subunit ribosomal protein L17
MRHGKKVNHLGRQTGHRRALLANLSISLIEHKRIQTTLAKAKALRLYLEPLITKSKNNTTHSRRTVFSYLQNKTAVQELFDNIAAKVADRPGGYLRIIRIGARLGDGAEMALIELVDYNETYSLEKKSASADKKKRTRRSKATGKDKEAPAAKDPESKASEPAAPAVEEIAEENTQASEETKEDDTIA